MRHDGQFIAAFVALSAVAVQTGCLQPVTEGPGPNSPAIETLFIVPVDEEDMGTLGAYYWHRQWPEFAHGAKAAFIQETSNGELLIDHLGGVFLRDGTFLQPPEEWRRVAGLYGSGHITDGWHAWRGTMYRTTSTLYEDRVTFWPYSPEARTISKGATVLSELDGGPPWGNYTGIKTTHGTDGGDQLCIGVFDQNTSPAPYDGGFMTGDLRLFDSPDDTRPEALSESIAGECIGSVANQDGVTLLVSHGGYANLSVIRRQFGATTTERFHLSDCTAPRQSVSGSLQFICRDDSSLSLWSAAPNRTQLLATLQPPKDARVAAFLRDEPLLYLRSSQAAGNNSHALEICSLDRCSDLLSVSGWPPAIGIIDSDILIADYVQDAGVRLRRIPPSFWEGL